MKIAFIISHLRHAGPVNVLYSVIMGLLEARHCAPPDVTVVTLSPEQEGSRLADFRALGVQLRHVAVHAARPVAGALALRRALREIAPDVCHSHCVKADGLLAVSSLGLPFARISTVHNIPREDLALTYPGVRGLLATQLHYAALRFLRGQLVGCSQTVSKHLQDVLGAPAVTVLNPVVVPPGAAQASARDPRRAVSAGVISRRKNTERMLELFLASPTCRDLRISVFGQGPERDRLTRELPGARIEWCDYSNALGREFRTSAVFISASLSEGMPLTSLEALLCGCPCVLSDIPQHREVAQLCPGRVFIFDPSLQDSFDHALAAALYRSEATPHELDRLAQRLSPSVAASEYISTYEAALASAPPRAQDVA